MLAPITQILQETRILRRRMLPAQARLRVRKGQFVEASDLIAEAIFSRKHQLIDIARGLGIPPGQATLQVKCGVGNIVEPGDILAGPVGMTRRVVRATQAGRVALLGEGQVLVELTDQLEVLHAGMPGEVMDLIPDHGALITAEGALIQGVWGNGRIGQGFLRLAMNQEDGTLALPALEEDMQGAILVGGCCMDDRLLNLAVKAGAAGMILAGLHPGLLSIAQELPFPVMSVEGFVEDRRRLPGDRPVPGLNLAVLQIMEKHSGHQAALNAEAWDRVHGTRPELVIPMLTGSVHTLPTEVDLLAPGMRVRIVREPYLGIVGQLLDLPGMVTLANGIKAECAEVQLARGKTVLIPLVNLDLIS